MKKLFFYVVLLAHISHTHAMEIDQPSTEDTAAPEQPYKKLKTQASTKNRVFRSYTTRSHKRKLVTCENLLVPVGDSETDKEIAITPVTATLPIIPEEQLNAPLERLRWEAAMMHLDRDKPQPQKQAELNIIHTLIAQRLLSSSVQTAELSQPMDT
jgi:hypothetical protein